MKKLLGLIIISALSQPIEAAKQVLTLSVKNMSCAMCPITVKKSLQKVKGVNEVAVSFKQKTVTVTYDDTIASPEALILAPTNAGYPASIKVNNGAKK